MNIGLRYELAPPLSDAHQQMSSIDYSMAPSPAQSFASKKTGVAKRDPVRMRPERLPKGLRLHRQSEFRATLGVVWSPMKKTVISVGGGVFYANNDDQPAVPSGGRSARQHRADSDQ